MINLYVKEVCDWHKTKLRSLKKNGKRFSLQNNIMYWGKEALKFPFLANYVITRKKGFINVLPADRSYFPLMTNLSQGPAGQVLMKWFPVVMSDFWRTAVISCTGSRWSVPAVGVILGMFLKTDPHQQENVTVSTLFLLTSRKKEKRSRQVNNLLSANARKKQYLFSIWE